MLIAVLQVRRYSFSMLDARGSVHSQSWETSRKEAEKTRLLGRGSLRVSPLFPKLFILIS